MNEQHIESSVEICDLRDKDNEGLFEAVYRDLLVPAFDPAELDTFEVMRDGLLAQGSDEAWGLCAVKDGEIPVSCILGYPFVAAQVLLIGYIATCQELRSHGLGARLMNEVRQRWFSSDRFSIVVAEVDDPRYYPRGDIDPVRRIAFYERESCDLIVAPYFQPRLREDMARVYDMFLVLIHTKLGMVDRANGRLPTAQLVQFLNEYFESSEGEEISDPEGLWLVNWYKQRESVELRSIAEYEQCQIPRPPRTIH